jgi:hypothetical protein
MHKFSLTVTRQSAVYLMNTSVSIWFKLIEINFIKFIVIANWHVLTEL